METYDFDLYEALDLGPDAHEAEIKKAYRQLALLHHPDRTGGNETNRFLQIKTAYDVLIDRDKRTNYDAFHSDRRFARDRRPLTAKEAAWLVDAQKRAWGVREVQPFAVCILCDSCPCPADGVCYTCGMHFCQMCVRKMHCRDGIAPHYPVRQSSDFRKKLEEQGREQEKERKLLRGATSNQWLMRDEDFRQQRDIYRERCRRGAAECCQYYAWGQTKYTVHLALWIASEDCEADVDFRQAGEVGEAGEVVVEEEGAEGAEGGGGSGQMLRVTPRGQPTLLEGRFAHGVDAGRVAEALTFESMHCLTMVLPKARPGERWRRLFVGEPEGHRELRTGPPTHSVQEEHVGGFKPANHHRVAARKDSASEQYEVTVEVRIPEAAERCHVSVQLEHSGLRVAVAGLFNWQRRLQQRVITWADQHTSRAHIDLASSTWLLSRDADGRRCVQFVLNQWMEGASKNDEADVRRQLEAQGNRVLLEDADPLHMYELLEAEMFLSAGQVFKRRGELSPKARELLEEMETHERKAGRPEGEAGLRRAPFADLWQQNQRQQGRRSTAVVPREEEGAEVEAAAEWYASCLRDEEAAWALRAAEAAEAEAARAMAAAEARVAAEARAAAAAAARREEAELDAARRRKQQLKQHREERVLLAAAAGTPAGAAAGTASGGGGGGGGRSLSAAAAVPPLAAVAASLSVEEARETAAAVARANPPPPKRLPTEGTAGAAAACATAGGAAGAAVGAAAGAAAVEAAGAAGGAAAGAPQAAAAQAAARVQVSLNRSGYYFEDMGDQVKVTVPMEAALKQAGGGALDLDEHAATASFDERGFRLEVALGGAGGAGGAVQVLSLPELWGRILPDKCRVRVPVKGSRRVLLQLAKQDPATVWRKLTPM